MKQEEYFSLAIILILSISIGILMAGHSILSKEVQLYKVILQMDSEYSQVSLDSQSAESYYSEANSAYESGKYDLVQSNCRLARDYFLKESQGYKSMKAELTSYDLDDKLIDLYSNELDQLIIITNSMYETCEHWESAANYYDQNNYDMGTLEIDTMNKKIAVHDAAVEKYNQLLADFMVELEGRLGK